MEGGAANGAGFAARDRRAATTFAERGRGGRGRADRVPGRDGARRGRASPHLRSRLEVEEILLTAVPASTALRASIVIGAGSSSFRVLVRLVERLRLLPMPRWRSNRTQPIDERDVIEYLARTPTVAEAAGRSLDICGPDVLTFAALIEGIAEGLGVGRMPRGPPRLPDPAGERGGGGGERPAARARAPADGEPRVRRPAARPREAARMYGIRPRPFERAVEHALAEWESARAAGGAMKVERQVTVAAPPQKVYDVVMDSTRLADWVTIHDHLVGDPPRRLEKGSQLTQCLKLAGRRFKVRWTVVENDPAAASYGKGAGPWAPTRGWSTGSSRATAERASVPEPVRPTRRPARAAWRSAPWHGPPARSSPDR